MKFECNIVWNERREHNRKKVRHLIEKLNARQESAARARARDEPAIRGVRYRDTDLKEEFDDKNEAPVIYGGVQLSDEAKSAAKLNPKMMVYTKINSFDQEVAIEKGINIVRYSCMNNRGVNDGDAADIRVTDPLDLANKSLNMGNVYNTDLPTCQYYIPPRPASLDIETCLQTAREELCNVTNNYIKKTEGKAQSNLTEDEKKGIKELKTMVANKEAVIFKTDKTSKLSIDTLENYSEELKAHTVTDSVIDRSEVERIENKMNQNLYCLNRIFSVGSSHGNKNVDRVTKASTSTNVEPPVLRGQKKDHKNVTPVPLRPVCGVVEAPNARLSHMLSLILDMIADTVSGHHECRSSENMRAGFERYNLNTSEEDKREAVILSMDVKSLYPSITKAVAKRAIEDLLKNTDLSFLNINWWEAVKYVFVTISQQEIDDKRLSEVIPSRVKKSARLTVNCLQNNADDDEKCIRAARIPNGDDE